MYYHLQTSVKSFVPDCCPLMNLVSFYLMGSHGSYFEQLMAFRWATNILKCNFLDNYVNKNAVLPKKEFPSSWSAGGNNHSNVFNKSYMVLTFKYLVETWKQNKDQLVSWSLELMNLSGWTKILKQGLLMIFNVSCLAWKKFTF